MQNRSFTIFILSLSHVFSSESIESDEISRDFENDEIWKMYNCWCLTRLSSRCSHLTKSGDVFSWRKTKIFFLWNVTAKIYDFRFFDRYLSFFFFHFFCDSFSPLESFIDLFYFHRLRNQNRYLNDFRREIRTFVCQVWTRKDFWHTKKKYWK